eukprot:ctg_1879.g560
MRSPGPSAAPGSVTGDGATASTRVGGSRVCAHARPRAGAWLGRLPSTAYRSGCVVVADESSGATQQQAGGERGRDEFQI